MTLKEAVAKIDELERRIRDLEARPVFVPQPYPVPMWPHPLQPIWQQPQIGTPTALPAWTITCNTTDIYRS